MEIILKHISFNFILRIGKSDNVPLGDGGIDFSRVCIEEEREYGLVFIILIGGLVDHLDFHIISISIDSVFGGSVDLNLARGINGAVDIFDGSEIISFILGGGISERNSEHVGIVNKL